MAAYTASTLASATSIITRSVIGNKRLTVAKIELDGTQTWPANTTGLSIPASLFGMSEIESLSIDGGVSGLSWGYDYEGHLLHAYTAHGTPGATVALIEAQGVTPAASKLRLTAIGYGLR